ncbi:MAG: cupin domain-containing protein [Anaerolineaceae bacterium]|nr:cupin domain-containing protein [Anaerolineaceae bacterium]
MIETKFTYSLSDQKTIEKVVNSEHALINHMILPQGEALPLHHANSNVFMIVVRGQITLRLGDQEAHTYPTGSILTIPNGTLMDVSNQHEPVLEFFVVKAPSPSAK